MTRRVTHGSVYNIQDMPGDSAASVERLAATWGIPVGKEASGRLELFIRKLLEWNKSVNLTGAKSLQDVVGEHLPDSFALAAIVPGRCAVVDVGAGGGLPGVPFAILCPECEITLVEPRAKRVAFLNMVVREIGSTSIRVIRARAGDVVSRGFSVACSRATFKPEEWMEIGPRLLRADGRLVVFATSLPTQPPVDMKLEQHRIYETAGGSPRWAGCYCFT